MPMMSTDKKNKFSSPESRGRREAHLSHDRPGSTPAFKSDDIDVSLLKDISDLLEKVTGLGGIIKPQTDSPSVPEPATSSPSPTPEAPAATPDTPSIYTQKPKETSKKSGGLTSQFTGWEDASEPTPPSTPDTSTAAPATPATPAATGGKMQGAGKRLGSGVRDFGTGFGEGFSGEGKDSGSGSGVNINIGGGGGATAPADTSAADDASMADAVTRTGKDYSQGEATRTSDKTEDTSQKPPEEKKYEFNVDDEKDIERQVTSRREAIAEVEPDLTPEQVERKLKEQGYDKESVEQKTREQNAKRERRQNPTTGDKVRSTVKRVARSTTPEGRERNQKETRRKAEDKQMEQLLASDDRLSDYPQFEKSEELVKSWNYSG